MTTPFIEPLELFKRNYQNPRKKLPNTQGWLTLLADPVNHPAAIDFIERLAAENHSMAEAIRMLNARPINVDHNGGYDCYIGAPSFSDRVAKRVRQDVKCFESTYRHSIVGVLTELGVDKPVDVAMQIAYRAGYEDGSGY